MISKAVARFIRISPRKTRLAADILRGKSIDEAKAILMNLEKRARIYLEELLKSAVANAGRNPDISPADLYISKVTVDGGPMFKRYRAGSMGRAMMIKHRTSHILIELDRKKGVAKKPETSPPRHGRQEAGRGVQKPATKIKVAKLVHAKRGK